MANGGIRCLGRNYGSSNGPVRYIPKKGVNKVDDRESLSVEVPGLIEIRKISNGKVMTFKVSQKDRSWVRKGEFPGLTESRKISYGKAMAFKVLRKEDDNVSWVRKGEFLGLNGGQLPNNNFCTNSFASPASGVIKRDLAAEEEISQILDKGDDDYMEVPEQDSEEIGCHAGKFNDSEVLMGGKVRNNVEESAIQLLATRGLINDSLYAEAFSRSRWSSSCRGLELYKTGVNQADDENAVKLVFQDSDSHGEQESPRQTLSKISLEHLYVLASKQWGPSRRVPIQTRRSQLVWWL